MLETFFSWWKTSHYANVHSGRAFLTKYSSPKLGAIDPISAMRKHRPLYWALRLRVYIVDFTLHARLAVLLQGSISFCSVIARRMH